MSSSRIDPSLVEVRQWRESLQAEIGHLHGDAKIHEINRRTEEVLRRHGLKLVTVEQRVAERR